MKADTRTSLVVGAGFGLVLLGLILLAAALVDDCPYGADCTYYAKTSYCECR